MKSGNAPQLPLLRSEAQARILTRLFLADPGEPQSLTQLSRDADVPIATTYREIELLEQAGIVTSRRIGNTRLVSANTESPIYGELKTLLEKVYGPVPVLRKVLETIDGVTEAFIYGSWARRAHGEPGPPPRDIDLAIIGDPDVDAVFAACSEAELRLGIEVNPTVLTQDEWKSGRSGFLKSLRSGTRAEVLPGTGEK